MATLEDKCPFEGYPVSTMFALENPIGVVGLVTAWDEKTKDIRAEMKKLADPMLAALYKENFNKFPAESQDSSWAKNAVDAFLLAKLDEKA